MAFPWTTKTHAELGAITNKGDDFNLADIISTGGPLPQRGTKRTDRIRAPTSRNNSMKNVTDGRSRAGSELVKPAFHQGRKRSVKPPR